MYRSIVVQYCKSCPSYIFPGNRVPDLAGKFPIFPKTQEFPVCSPFSFPVPVFSCSRVWGIFALFSSIPGEFRRNPSAQRSRWSKKRKLIGSSHEIVTFYLVVNLTMYEESIRPIKNTHSELSISFSLHMEPNSQKRTTDRPFSENTVCGTGSAWMVPLESRERFGEGVPAQIAGTYRFSGNSRGILREYATKP